LTDSKGLRVLHIITGLATGGAEMMLLKLLESTATAVDSKVVVLMRRGALSGKVESLGVDVEYLDVGQGRLPNPGTVLRMLSMSRQFSPDVIQGWMYHGNLAAWLVSRFASRQVKLFWNIRQTLYDLACERRLTRWLIGLSRCLSSAPDKIVYNSALSAHQHEAIGYPQRARVVIPNGFNLQGFKPDESTRDAVRLEFGLDPAAPLVIHVARYHPMKDHRNLLTTAKQVLEGVSGVKFLLVGHGVSKENEDLNRLCQDTGLRNTVILAGERFDLPQLMAAADVAVLSSAWGEGFPNVVGEAMACGTPCVVTDVGDSTWVVGECGRVVPPCDADALSKAIVALLSDNNLRKDLGYKARQRIQDLFSIEKVSKTYLDLYQGKLV
jgi:glycosyltransferase involved in cell wall biosynthesis